MSRDGLGDNMSVVEPEPGDAELDEILKQADTDDDDGISVVSFSGKHPLPGHLYPIPDEEFKAIMDLR